MISEVPVEHSRQVVGSFDTLVRSARFAPAQSLMLADRACTHWRLDPALLLEFSSDGLSVRDELILVPDDAHRSWMLPVVMAGLRSIRMRPEASPDDFIQLALELSAVQVDEDSIRSFHDWVWADGAEGFDIVLTRGFVETSDSLRFGDEAETSAIGVVRGLASIATEGGIEVLSKDLDVAVLRPEMEVDVDAFDLGARHGAFDASQAEIEALREHVEDAAAWSMTEMEALLDSPSLREGLPPKVFARRLSARLVPPVRVEFLRMLRTVVSSDDDYLERASAHLDELDVGQRLGQALTLSEEALAVTSDLIEVLPPQSAARLTGALFERAGKEEPAARMLTTWIDLQGMPKVSTATFSAPAAVGLVEVLQRSSREGAARIALHTLSDGSFVKALRKDPTLIITSSLERLRELLESGSEKAIGRAVMQLDQSNAWSLDVLTMTIEVFAQRAEGWPASAVRLVARAARRHKVDARAWVPLARATNVDDDVRLAILQELGQVPEFRDAVLKFRWSKILDSGAVSVAIREMKAELTASATDPEEE